MKYILLILLLSSYTIELNAQVPQKMSYQAIIRDANNNLLSLKNINIRISIIRGEFESITVYSEIQSGKTNLNGLVSLQIGTGILKTGDFKKIDWSKGSYFIKTETDPDGGFDFKIIGSSELLSVPYALYALNNTAGFDTTSLHTRIVELQYQAAENKFNIEKNIDSIKNNEKNIKRNLDSINKQGLEIIENIDSIRVNAKQIDLNLDVIRVNSVKIKNNVDSINTKIDVLDLIAILSSYQRVGKILNAFTVDEIDSIDIKSNGNLKSSKNISLTGNIESLGLSSSIGTLEKPFKDLYISSNSLFIASDIVGQNIPPTILSNLNGNLQLSSGGFKLMGENTAFIAPKFEGRLTGNANTATKLETSRRINGMLFDGSSDITIASVSANALTYTNTGTGDLPGGTYDGSLAKTISYNSLGASPLVGSSSITTVGTLNAGSIPYTLLTGTVPIWNQSTLGNAATVTTNANLIGVVTSIGNVTSIASGTITNSMIANTAVANLSGTNTGDESSTSIKTKLGVTTLSGDNTGDQTSVTGNAGTATKLENTRLINGVAFDGNSDITITAVANAGTLSGTTLNGTIVNSSLTSVGTLGNLIVSGIITGTLSGTATSANTVTTNANLTGVVTSLGNVTSIASGTITNSMIANTAVANLSGTNTGDQTSITGNAGTATKLAATKLINGVAFDGSSDITITAVADAGTLSGTTLNGTIVNSSLTSVGTLGNLTVTNPIVGSITGNAASVTTNANLTGVVTSVDNVTSIASGTINNSMIANTAVANLSGTNTGDQVLPTLASLGGVASNTAITGATKTKITFDNKGLVTEGADATTADIASSVNRNYVTDIQAGVISNTSGINTGDQTNITGNAATVTTNANLTGVVTSIGNVTSIATGTITNSMIANTAVANLTGINTGDQVLPTLASLGGVASNTAITGATKTKITYDSKGLVTAGADATTADIAASTNRNYVTDVQAGVISNTSGTNTGDQTSVTGNAGTATKLAASKLINGVAFDGSSDITITAVADAGTLSGTVLNGTIVNSSLTSLGTLSNLTVTNPITGSVTGNAATVTTNANLTGVVTSIGNATSIASGTITNSMLANTAVANLSGINTGDETTATIKTKLSITTLTGSNTGDQILPTLASLGGVASNTAITGATKTKITYDTKGLVTAGADATTADIAASTNKNYVTDVQAGVISNTSGTNTGDESTATIKAKLGITTISGDNTGDETTATIKTKLSITTLTGSNTGDQILPTLASLGGVASNTAITGATKTKITYDAKGLVTAGVDATTADIAASINKNYVTDVQAGVISNTSGINTGDENTASIKTKLSITTLTGSNTGDQVLPTLASLGGVASNTAITGATKTKITFDAKGLVTAGADATTADIAASTNRNYVTDVQAGVISNTSGTNTGDETTATIKTKLSITTLTGSNTGDQILPTLASLGGVASNTAITGATKIKITYDAKGLVTAGADATTADIAVSVNRNYVTDIQAGVISNTSGINTGDNAVNSNYSGLVTNATHTGDATGSSALTVVRINGTSLASLGTGILKNTTGTGVPSIAIASDFPTLNQSTSGNAATVTTNANLTGMVTSIGNATTVVTNANLTGDVTSVGNTSTIGALKVTNGMIAATTIDLTSKVTGTLPIANGGTNSTATPTAGGINYGTGTAQVYTAVGTSGQFLQSNGTGTPVWVAQPGPASVTILTSLTPNSTYNVPLGVKAIMVELIGAGGGSGGSVAANTQKGSASGGGGSGTYTRKLIIAPSASYVYTIGIAGAGGSTLGTNGGDGGGTSFIGTSITAPGGKGGQGCTASTTGNGGFLAKAGGVGGLIGANGDFSVPGHAGGVGFVLSTYSIGGDGANSFFGDGPGGSIVITAQSTGIAHAATGYGAGASGSAVLFGAALAGAAGYQGVIIITEYK